MFQASETLPGTVTAVLLRQYVGVNVEVQETLHGVSLTPELKFEGRLTTQREKLVLLSRRLHQLTQRFALLHQTAIFG